MANQNPSRLGQINAAGDVDALFLKVFAGEVLTAFRENRVFIDRHMVRSITSGKSAQFPATWKGGAFYHTAGDEILGTSIAHNERIIVIDDMLIAPRFIAEIDDLKNHYDIRSEYSFDVGRALRNTFEANIAQVIVLASRATATVTGANGGSTIDAGATVTTSASVLIQAIFDASQALDEKDVPEEDRQLALAPALYNLMVNASAAANRDFGGSGSISQGILPTLAGFPVLKSNNVPKTVVSTGPAPYQGDFTATKAVAWHRSAAGTVKLKDLAVRTDFDPRRLGTQILGMMAVGHGILRPEAAVEITNS